MNNNGNSTATTVVAVVLVLLVILGIYYLVTNTPSSTTSNTPESSQSTPQPSSNAQTPTVPLVSTSAASFASQSTAVLNGNINPNGTQTSYWYEYGAAQTLGSFTAPQLIGAGYVNYSAPTAISGLKPSTQYYYRLAAQNQFGKVYGDISSFTTTTTAPISFPRPIINTKDATVITQDSATLNGTVNAVGTTTNYWFEYGSSFGLGFATPSSTVNGATNVTVSSPLTGLLPDTTYYYRLDAQNPYGTVIGNISIFTTQPTIPPPPPTGKAPSVFTSSATGIAKTTAILNGQINPNGSATTFHFEYGKATAFGSFTLDQKTADKSAGSGKVLAKFSQSITDLDSNSTYYFELVAQNQYGTTHSAIFSFTTKNK